MLALLAPLFALNAQRMRPREANGPAVRLTEEQKIRHVLNRLGFGARPGDVERVRRIGLDRYIERQLDPDTIDDRRAENMLRRFDLLEMSAAEIFAKYPNPGALLRRLGETDGRQPPPGENGAMTGEKSEQQQQTERRERRRKLLEIYRRYDLRPARQIVRDLSAARVLRAVYSERQLEEQMVDFWTNHFNVYAGKGAVRWYLPGYDRDVIRRHALGNFRDLLIGTAQHPAMLFYLDNFQSVAPAAGQDDRADRRQRRLERMLKNGRLDPRVRARLKRRGLSDDQIDRRIEQLKQGANRRRQRGLNENYARELMELHTLGVDGGYTQKDIQEVARAFTGWTIFDARGYRRAAADMISDRENRRLDRLVRQLGISPDTPSGSFVFVERLHDRGVKTVLGHRIDRGGIGDGLQVIDILVRHPSTAKFIARKLAVKFVSDQPDERLVNRIAEAFRKSDGDIKTTLRAIFTSDEFYASYRTKIKTPFELLVSSLRALDADTNAGPVLLALLRKMGEPLYGYQAPTGYPDTAADWVNTGALLERMNFAVALAAGRIRGTRVDLSGYAADDREMILDRAIDEILGGEIAPQTRAVLLKQIAAPLGEPRLTEEDDSDSIDIASLEARSAKDRRQNRQNRRNRLLAPSGDPEVFKVVGLLLGSPDFQRQ